MMHSDGPSLNLGTHTMHPSTSLFFKLLVTMPMMHLVSRNVKPSTRAEVIVLSSPANMQLKGDLDCRLATSVVGSSVTHWIAYLLQKI